MATTAKVPPWKKKKPPGPTKNLSTARIAEAKAAAATAGRRYPNLIDNMRVARKAKSSA